MVTQNKQLGESLLEVAQIASGTMEGEFSYIDLSSVDKDEKQIDLDRVSRISWDRAPSRARQIVQSGDVLVSTVRPNLNGVALVPREMDGSIASSGFCVLRPDPQSLDSHFLFHWVRSPQFIDDMTRKATGASYPAVSDRIIHESAIPFPKFAEQQRIAIILDKADTVRRKRREALKLADELLRSAFLDLFGDPVANSKKWPLEPIANLADVTTGNTPSREITDYYGDHIEWIKSDNINTPSHYLTKAVEGLSEAGLKVGRSAAAGATLITCIAGSPACIGNAALADRPVAFNQQINALTPRESLESEFLYANVLFSKAKIQAASTQGMKGMVSKGALEQVRFIAPPPPLRKRFAQVFGRVMTVTHRLESAASDSEQLFKSLSARAFNGELATP
jgi:type I restriction enzyme, S subunit